MRTTRTTVAPRRVSARIQFTKTWNHWVQFRISLEDIWWLWNRAHIKSSTLSLKTGPPVSESWGTGLGTCVCFIHICLLSFVNHFGVLWSVGPWSARRQYVGTLETQIQKIARFDAVWIFRRLTQFSCCSEWVLRHDTLYYQIHCNKTTRCISKIRRYFITKNING